MTTRNPTYVAHCQCGAVETSAWGQPIIVNACYCDDCQAATQRLAVSANSGPASSVDGGTEFMMFRRDRIACTRGRQTPGNEAERLLEDQTDDRELLRNADVHGL